MLSLSFSIVVPTYNRPKQLARCLAALVALNYPKDSYEIIIVDDGSDEPLTSVVAPFENAAVITLIRQPNAGPAAARNTGLTQATGEYIAFTDDDCMPEPGWLQAFAIALQTNPQAMVGGHTLNALPQNLYSTASQSLIDYLYSYYDSASQGMFFASNNIAMARSQLFTIGGFDIAFPLAAAEDRNLCDCWQQAGYPMQYVPTATIQHAHALSLKSFWQQHFGYGRGAYCFHQSRAQRTEQAVKVEPMTFYTDLLAYPMKRTNIKSPLKVSSLFFLSQVATVAGFFWERATS